MNPGDIADGSGALWFRWWSPDADRVLAPDALCKLEHGTVWVTEHQAKAAEAFDWARIPEHPHDCLVAIGRSEADALKRRRRDEALSELARMDGEIL